MIMLKDFEPDDLKGLVERSVEPGIGEMDWRKWAEHHQKAGVCYTGVENGKPVFCAGVHFRRPGVGNVWTVISSEMAKSFEGRKNLLWSMKQLIAIAVETCGYHKLRTISKIGFAASQTLLEHLGFKNVRTKKEHYVYMMEVEGCHS